MQAERDEVGGRILLGDNTGGGKLLVPIIFRGFGVWIST